MHQISSQALKLLAEVPEQYQITLKRFSSRTNVIDITEKSLKKYIRDELGIRTSTIGVSIFGCRISQRPMFYSRSIDCAVELSIIDFREKRKD